MATKKINKNIARNDKSNREKQISVRLGKEEFQRLEFLFSGESRYSAARICIEEGLNNIWQCMKNLKGRLSKDEIKAFIIILHDWKMDLSSMNVRLIFEQRIEDYSRMVMYGGGTMVMLPVLKKFNDFELYTILRHIKKACSADDPFETACKDFEVKQGS
jgi:predicted DNA-binding protein